MWEIDWLIRILPATARNVQHPTESDNGPNSQKHLSPLSKKGENTKHDENIRVNNGLGIFSFMSVLVKVTTAKVLAVKIWFLFASN